MYLVQPHTDIITTRYLAVARAAKWQRQRAARASLELRRSVLCPRSDSNRHWKDFKSSVSAIGLRGPRASSAAVYLMRGFC